MANQIYGYNPAYGGSGLSDVYPSRSTAADRYLSNSPLIDSSRYLSTDPLSVSDSSKHSVIDRGSSMYFSQNDGLRYTGSKLRSDSFLITNILKNKLGIKVFVISDWEGINRLSQTHGSDYHYCISTSIYAGVNMVIVPFRYEEFLEDLIYRVESGNIPMARIDDVVERILRVKFVFGFFEHPSTDRSLLNAVGRKKHRELAIEAVRRSLILLKNGKDLKKLFLPLDRNVRRILVAGSHADNLGFQCGGWTITGYGTGGRITIGTTILDAIKETVGDKTEIIYEQYPSPATFADQDFSFVIVVVGEAAYAEGLGDNSELKIPFNGPDLINSVAERVPTLVIMISRRPAQGDPRELYDGQDVLADRVSQQP